MFFVDQEIYKYILIKPLGKGAFGEVWLAKDTILDKVVAIKLIPSFALDEGPLKEARTGIVFKHSNLVEIFYADYYALDNEQIVTIIAQEFHSKGSIINFLNAQNFLPVLTTLKYAKDILYGLEHLHVKSFLHNDVKPSNILISDNNVALLTDYGISTAYTVDSGAMTQQAYFLHCAPETQQKEGYIDQQSDIYQLGCTIYRLLNGIGSIEDEFLKHGRSVFHQYKIKGKIPNKNSYSRFVPAQLKKIINKSLDPKIENRFKTARDMRRALERLAFAGDWTVNNDGIPFGRCGNYEFFYDVEIKPNKKFNFITTKKIFTVGK